MKMLTGMAVAAAVFWGPVVANAQTSPTGTITGTRLDITARGDVRRVPDVAVISAGVVTQAIDAAAAMRENAGRMSRVIAALKSAGVADKDMSTSSISLSPQYRYVENQAPVITGYQASNQLTIRFRDIAKSGGILDVLVKQGANQINGPTLTIDKPDAAQDEARIDAVKRARTRAELYARATGLKIKRIVSISESEGYSGPPVQLAQFARVADAAAKTDIEPGEQSISVTVSVVFELE
ncbi:MAG: SIMPL domain-containing protein [Sphingomonadaceae bacterium]